MKAGRLPAMSPKSPNNVGAMPWKIMYVVRVKLMRLTDTPKEVAMGFRAGKYMFCKKALGTLSLALLRPGESLQLSWVR